jgi:hypothetical protein
VIEAWSEPIVALGQRVAGPAGVIERQLAICVVFGDHSLAERCGDDCETTDEAQGKVSESHSSIPVRTQLTTNQRTNRMVPVSTFLDRLAQPMASGQPRVARPQLYQFHVGTAFGRIAQSHNQVPGSLPSRPFG